jgi:hypothetical protein
MFVMLDEDFQVKRRKKMIVRIIIALITVFTAVVYSEGDSPYYKKGNNWQESVSNSIKTFHKEWEKLRIMLNDESIIKLGDWYSVGGFAGDRDKLHKMEFGPEKNPGLDQVYAGERKWMAHPDWKDGQAHHFEGEAREVTYLQRSIDVSKDMDILAYVSSDDGLHVWLNGQLIFENDADRGLEPNQEFIPLQLKKGENIVMLKINNRGGPHGYFFSLQPDEDVYTREVEKIWVLASRDFSDAKSIFQIEREKTDGIWDSQIQGYDESKLVENYLKKIKRIPAIAEYGKKYIETANDRVDVRIIRELYYLTCKFDNISYLDDAHESDDKKWNDYKSRFEVKAQEVASLLTDINGNEEQLSNVIVEFEEIFSNVPLRLPSGLDSKGRFGAYYTTLKYDLDWDKHWRIGEYADVVVNFDRAGYKFVFWRGTSYIPCWVTETGIWYTNEFVERRGFHSPNTEGCVEPMSDKQCRYSHVRIIESTDARVVVHWRYAPVDVRYEHPFTDPVSGWSDWVDEVYTIYPSGIGVREITVQTNRPDLWTEFQEAIVINQPGTMPEDNIELGAISLANMEGQSKTYFWTEQGGPEFEEGPDHASIFKVNLKAAYSPFALVAPPTEDGNLITSYLGHAPTSNFNFWDHWPVSQDASDGRTATSAERPSHSSLGHIGLPGNADVEWLPYKAEGIKRTKIMLHGMTDKAAEDLVPLAKSWLYAPELNLISSGYISEGYDPTQAAYVITTKKSNKPAPLSFTITAGKECPVINPAFVIKNWGRADIDVKVDDQTLIKSEDYRTGYHQTISGYNLILWLKKESEKHIQLEILSKTKWKEQRVEDLGEN